MKTCSKCNQVKLLSLFPQKGAQCKACVILYQKEWRKRNPEKSIISTNKYRQKCPDKVKETAFNWRKANPDKVRQNSLSYRKRDPTKANKPTIKYQLKRRKTDLLFKLTHNIRTLIAFSIKKGGFSKSSKTADLLGCSFKELQEHLINTAIKNYGFYDPSFKYHIDHIIPCASAKTEEELIKLQCYTNLQYLTPKDNLKKSNN